MTLGAPEALAEHHRIENFESGEASLDDWLKRRARANQASGATRCFVACDGRTVIGYYALASGAVDTASAPGRFRRNMPEPIPIAVLARLAVHRDRNGHGLGRALFQDCAARVLSAAEIIGIRGVVVHAISSEAKAFYLALGLTPSPLDPMTLMVALSDISARLAR